MQYVITFRPVDCLNHHRVQSVRERVVEKVCLYQDIGDACVCENKIHQKVAQEVQNIETNAFGPLHLNKGRGKTLAVLLVYFKA